jgi:uncharacterized membrane protein YbhN (UPF0104 family)
MLKTFFLNTIKILVAAGLIYWLLTSGKLDFILLAKLHEHPWMVFSSVSISLINMALVSYRWETILRVRAMVTLPISGLFRISWIGQFFSSVLPGSVSGDLVKILYVQKFDKSFTKKFVFASILIDRVMGLCGLILLVGISSLLFGGHILKNAPAMKPLLNMNYGLVVLVIVSFAFFYFCHHWIRKFFEKGETINPAIFQKLIILWDDIVLFRTQMLKAIGLSIIVQFNGVLIFWFLIKPFVGGHMDFVQSLAFIPLGLMALALPVAPSGLGVGHAIFQKLFEFSGIDNGASLFNLYFVVTLSINVLGVIPYLLTKARED